MVLGNFVLDVGENGKILGIEIDCASKFFKISPEQLGNLKTTSIEVIKFGNMITLGLLLTTEMKEYHFQFAMPQKNKAPIIFC